MASFKKICVDNWQVSFYCKDYLGNNKKYKKSGFKTKKEASDYSAEFIKKMTGASSTKLITVVEEFIEYKKDKIKFNTLIRYKKNYKKILNSDIANIEINKIETKHAIIFFNKFNNTPALQKDLKIFLGMIYDYAKIFYNIKNNIIRNIKIDNKKENQKEKCIFTLEEFKKFDEILIKENYPKTTRLYFNLLYFTGARLGEIAGLTIEDFDFENNVININKTRIRNNFSNTPKNTSSIRKVTVPIKIMNFVKEIINKLPNIKTIYIFNTPVYYSIFLQKILKKHNELPKITAHGFRHSHVSFLINQNIEITAISKRIGHKNSNITLSVYSHFYQEKEDKIEKLLNFI